MDEFSGVGVVDVDVVSVYEKLGIATASQRAYFNGFAPQPSPIPMEIVISTTSQPFNR